MADEERADAMTWRSFGAALLSSWRATWGQLAVVLVAAALAWYLGADVWHAVLVGVVVAVLGLGALVVQSEAGAANEDWPDDDRRRAGARHDVADLSRSLRSGRGRAGDVALDHVRRVAERRLAARQLDLRRPADREAIERLIGAGSYAVLVGGRQSQRALLRCMDALDALDSTATVRRARSPMTPSRRIHQ